MSEKSLACLRHFQGKGALHMNDEKANISYKLNKLIFCAGVIVFLFVNISLLIHFGDISYRGSTRFEFNKLILTLISVGLLATLTALAVFLRNLHLDERSKSLIIVAITGLHFFVLLIIGNELANEPGFNWDEGFIFADAQRLLDGTPLSNYFISVPHGVGTLAVDVIVIFLSRLLGYTEIIQIVRVFILANALAIEGTILCCTSVVKSICKRKEGFAEFLVPSMAYLFIPYYFYSLLLYSDTYSLFFSALTIKLYTDYCKHSKSQKDKRKYIYIYICNHSSCFYRCKDQADCVYNTDSDPYNRADAQKPQVCSGGFCDLCGNERAILRTLVYN